MSLDDLSILNIHEIGMGELEVGKVGNFELDEGQSVSRQVQLRDSQGHIRASAQVTSPLYLGPRGLINYSLTVTEVFP